MDEILRVLAEHGIAGVIAAIAIWIAWQKDKQVTSLWGQLVAKSDAMRERYHTLATELNATLEALSEAIFEDDKE
jgi:hypothetical protein